MRSEGIGQAERSGELCAVGTRPQNPQRDVGTRRRYGLHPLAGHHGGEIGLQLEHVLRKIIAAPEGAAKRLDRHLVGAGRAAEAEIDPARE